MLFRSASIEALQTTMGQALRRPELMRQSATALGLLGDKSAAEALQRHLCNDSGNLATFAALAQALSLIGDRRMLPSLGKLLLDPDRAELPRAFAAAALGGIADRALQPWGTRIAANLNYRASVETLTDGMTGILDLL